MSVGNIDRMKWICARDAVPSIPLGCCLVGINDRWRLGYVFTQHFMSKRRRCFLEVSKVEAYATFLLLGWKESARLPRCCIELLLQLFDSLGHLFHAGHTSVFQAFQETLSQFQLSLPGFFERFILTRATVDGTQDVQGWFGPTRNHQAASSCLVLCASTS